uniref:Uncharacterized protein n=1 Tax=Pipistrellus kuhlii TaxID=59472 RepID=A0A7J8A7T7_PIPKU|nr:hypothetical protein mPipKuh1_008938 [Pipistrellus kuhlii]
MRLFFNYLKSNLRQSGEDNSPVKLLAEPQPTSVTLVYSIPSCILCCNKLNYLGCVFIRCLCIESSSPAGTFFHTHFLVLNLTHFFKCLFAHTEPFFILIILVGSNFSLSFFIPLYKCNISKLGNS